MTLSERLNQYIKKHHLSGAEVANRTGVCPTQVSEIRLRNKYTPFIAERIYNAFGDEFKEFVEYDTCPYCGGRYIRRRNDQRTCLSSDCLKKNRTDKAKEYEQKVNSGEHVKRPYEERQPAKKKYMVQLEVKPKISYAEFNERARSQGLSYGQLQGLERLGLR